MSVARRLDAHSGAVTDFDYAERVPRQRAAEHLVGDRVEVAIELSWRSVPSPGAGTSQVTETAS